MTEEEAQKVLDELNEIKPGQLEGNAKRLFEAIMKIADNRDELQKMIERKDLEISSLKQVHDYDTKMIDDVKEKAVELYNRIDEKDKIIDLMAEEFKEKTLMYTDFTEEEIKQYFENKSKEV